MRGREDTGRSGALSSPGGAGAVEAGAYWGLDRARRAVILRRNTGRTDAVVHLLGDFRRTMSTKIYWTRLDQPGGVGVMPRPRGGDWLEDEIAALTRSGVTTLVSLLEPAEEEELDLLQERRLAQAAGLDYVSLPIADRGLPADKTAVLAVVDRLATAVAGGSRVVVHCRQGIGRAALVACALLMRLGSGADEAMSVVGAARGLEVPETADQVRWLREQSRILQSGGSPGPDSA